MTTDRPTSAGMQPMPFLKRIAAAEAPAQLLGAVQGYLNAWTRERIERLQSVDGGAAPFARDGRPARLASIADLVRLRDALRRRCQALRAAKQPLGPELVELDEIVFIASRLAEAMKRPEFRIRAPAAGAGSPLLNLV